MAKKKNRNIGRAKKKQLKKQAGLQRGEQISREELRQLNNKQIAKNKRKNAEARRYNENKEYLAKQGVPTDIITKSTPKSKVPEIAARYKKEQARAKRQDLQRRKIDYLVGRGYSREAARKIVGTPSKQLPWEKVKKSHERILESDSYLYVGYSDLQGYGFHTYRFSSPEAARAAIDEILSSVSDESSQKGTFVIDWYHGESKAIDAAQSYYNSSRNYIKEILKQDRKKKPNARDKIKNLELFGNRAYHKIVIENTWTEQRFLNMTASILSMSMPSEIQDNWTKLKRYDRDQTGNNYLRDITDTHKRKK